MCGESGEVQGSTIDSWKERLPEIVSGYTKENIYNVDETGVFWRALPSKGFGEKGKGVFSPKLISIEQRLKLQVH